MRKWTKEERMKQSQLIRSQQPWKHSTGPQTDQGKETSKMNSYKHGARCEKIRMAFSLLAEWKRLLKKIKINHGS